jgi:bifunctional non-homologous end joining protein LigD
MRASGATRIMHAAAAAAMRAAPSGRKRAGAEIVSGVTLTHPDRALWPGVTKRDLAEYWLAVAAHALPEIAGRPLALVRCPEGIDGERFFQKHGRPGFPKEIRAGEAGNAPYLALDDVAGLVACAQVAAIELHAWGAREADALHPDRVVFDLDPGESVAFAEVVRAALEVRERLERAGFAAFCRTTGGKGLHVLAPVTPGADWDATRAWCRGFAEAMAADSPDRYVSRLPKAEREGKILVDWLRNGLGSTAVASFSPRARPGATVATPLAWREVTAKLDPAGFTLASVPARLSRQRTDPWQGFAGAGRPIPG